MTNPPPFPQDPPPASSPDQMECPKCRGRMRTYNRNGVHIEQCETCKGIFLDHGELEAIGRLENQVAQAAAAQQPPPPPPAGYAPQGYAPQGYPPQAAYPYDQGPGWGYGGHRGRGRRGGLQGLFFSS
ncbi:MAG: zf-TFIIB domain-containing protein [Propionibacteriales bacterium]|nr:zf-TFIIB domain-containing protein [Propionibacteriales bacterium]